MYTAAVVCTLCCAGFPVRVQRQPEDNPGRGRVEILNNGRWGLVCFGGWDSRDATVVCQEENLGINGTAIELTHDQTETLWLSGVDCVGNESQLSSCPHNGLGMIDDCGFVAGVECFSKLISNNCDIIACN